ncbi:hypothetical protein ScPMuIL_009998 [Solemya velum]
MKVILKRLPPIGQEEMEEEEKNKNLKGHKKRKWLQNNVNKAKKPERLPNFNVRYVRRLIQESLQIETALRCEIHLSNLKEMRSSLEAMEQTKSIKATEVNEVNEEAMEESQSTEDLEIYKDAVEQPQSVESIEHVDVYEDAIEQPETAEFFEVHEHGELTLKVIVFRCVAVK